MIGPRLAVWFWLSIGIGGCVAPPFPIPSQTPIQIPGNPGPSGPETAAAPGDKLIFHFIDSGQGACILVECPSGGLILDDCGASKQSLSSLAVHRLIDGIISRHTGYALDPQRPLAVVASHPDRDHINLIALPPYVINPRLVYRVVISETLDRYPAEFRAWANDTPAVDTFPANFHGPLGDVQCGSAQVMLLTVNSGQSSGQPAPVSQTNADSAVVGIRYNNFLAVLPGDAEGSTQNAVTRNYPGLKVTLLAAPHHGAESAGSNSLAWARAVKPGIVVFTSAFANSFGHPRRSSIENYLAQPGLMTARRHHVEFYDGKTGPIAKTIDRAVFTTGFAGSIDVTVDSQGSVALDCVKSAWGGC